MIREIAEPILEQLKKIEKQLGNHRMPQLPQIKFVKEGNMQDGPFMIGDIEVTDELLEKVKSLPQASPTTPQPTRPSAWAWPIKPMKHANS